MKTDFSLSWDVPINQLMKGNLYVVVAILILGGCLQPGGKQTTGSTTGASGGLTDDQLAALMDADKLTSTRVIDCESQCPPKPCTTPTACPTPDASISDTGGPSFSDNLPSLYTLPTDEKVGDHVRIVTDGVGRTIASFQSKSKKIYYAVIYHGSQTAVSEWIDLGASNANGYEIQPAPDSYDMHVVIRGTDNLLKHCVFVVGQTCSDKWTDIGMTDLHDVSNNYGLHSYKDVRDFSLTSNPEHGMSLAILGTHKNSSNQESFGLYVTHYAKRNHGWFKKWNVLHLDPLGTSIPTFKSVKAFYIPAEDPRSRGLVVWAIRNDGVLHSRHTSSWHGGTENNTFDIDYWSGWHAFDANGRVILTSRGQVVSAITNFPTFPAGMDLWGINPDNHIFHISYRHEKDKDQQPIEEVGTDKVSQISAIYSKKFNQVMVMAIKNPVDSEIFYKSFLGGINKDGGTQESQNKILGSALSTASTDSGDIKNVSLADTVTGVLGILKVGSDDIRFIYCQSETTCEVVEP